MGSIKIDTRDAYLDYWANSLSRYPYWAYWAYWPTMLWCAIEKNKSKINMINWREPLNQEEDCWMDSGHLLGFCKVSKASKFLILLLAARNQKIQPSGFLYWVYSLFIHYSSLLTVCKCMLLFHKPFDDAIMILTPLQLNAPDERSTLWILYAHYIMQWRKCNLNTCMYPVRVP